MWKLAQTALSFVSDLLQVGGFLGLTPAMLVALATVASGWFANIPIFYVVVGTVVVFALTMYMSQAFILRVGVVPLADAARTAFEQLRDTLWGEAAVRLRSDMTSEGILDYLATGLSLHVAVYGKYSPSKRLERVADADLRSGAIEQGATVLQLRNNRHMQVTGLVVRKRDLRAAVKHMKDSTVQFNRK